MVAAAIVGGAVVGAVGTGMAADSAASAQDHAVDAQSAIAQQQQQLAQDQWDYQKNVYLPKAQQQADDQIAMSKQLTDAQIANADFYQGIAGQSFDQAKKSYEFQDDYMDMARDYLSGKTGNTMANQANADVNQAYSNTNSQLVRGAQRLGINPGSGAFASTLGDLYNQKALASAGAQTSAEQAARNKAEQMVATAAGSGAAGFGTGIQAGSVGASSLTGASNTNNTSLNGLNSVSNTLANGASSAQQGFAGASGTWNSIVKNASTNPWGDLASGLGNAGLKLAGSNAFGTSVPAGSSIPSDVGYGSYANFDTGTSAGNSSFGGALAGP